MPRDTRGEVAAAFETQADWRRQKAEEYPDDARNENAAIALTRLKEFALGLPSNDPQFARLEELTAEWDDALIWLTGPEVGEFIGRIGFDRHETLWTDERCYEEVRSVVDAVEEAIGTFRAEQGDT